MKYELRFERLSVNEKPTVIECDQQINQITPHEARLRNLTYETDIHLDMRKVIKIINKETGEEEIHEPESQELLTIGKIPVMIRSMFCSLHNLNDKKRVDDMKECVFDQVKYKFYYF